MSTLRSLVEATLAQDSTTLASLVRSKMGPSVDHAAWTAFLADYLREATTAAEALATVAAGHPLEAKVRPFLDHIASYVADPDDAVPDREGAIGLLDDACVVLVCIEALHALMNLPADQHLIAANTLVRALLGEAIDGGIRAAVQELQQRVVLATLSDLTMLEMLVAGAVSGEPVAMPIPTPTFRFPAPASAPATAAAPGTAIARDGAAAALVGVWEYAEIYISSGFNASTYVTRVLAADGRFSVRSRSQASQTHRNSDGSWAGTTDAETGGSPDERGRWSYDGQVLQLDHDDGTQHRLAVELGQRSHLTWPVAGGGTRKLWQRVG
jgi:uncharacterized membrane protein YkvA (DUF1232 family)